MKQKIGLARVTPPLGGATANGISTNFGPAGNQILRVTYCMDKEGSFTAELDLIQNRRARIRFPMLRDEHGELAARELRRILQSR